jgi:alpha-galactosidase
MSAAAFPKQAIGIVLVFLACVPMRGAVTASPEEMNEASQWVAAKFKGEVTNQAPAVGLLVLANNDPVQLNARAGRPMKIADKQYSRGLYCHAVSKVFVRLPGPAKSFSATVGVDSNEQTSGGRGSVIFSVNLGGKEEFRSQVIREGMAGVPVNVPLDGAREFVLNIGDAGDGISCDQSDWADAKVVLADGRELWLGDLPLLNKEREPYSAAPPFAFTYGGRASSEFLGQWKLDRETRKLDDQREQHTLTWTDPQSGLRVRCVGVQYHDYPTVEWTAYFKNTGAADSPIIENIQAIDTTFSSGAQGDCILRHHTGDLCTADSYQPHADPLPARSERKFANTGGRPTQSAYPFYNLGWPSEGVIVVLSWAGQWAMQFNRDDSTGVRVRGGQELTHFRLHPGEEVRDPMVVVQFYRGDWLRAQNIWRRWMLAHNLPRPNGKPVHAQLAACSSHQFGEMINANTRNQMEFIDRYRSEHLNLDYWWMDAGWYWNKSGWPNTGTWEVDTNRFPGGLRPICDHAHAGGEKTIVWFEPERVTPGTFLHTNNPAWLLGEDGQQKLLNLGNDEARQWLTDHVSKTLTAQGVDLYRQDFNMDPLPFWRRNDAPDRQGITEIRHITGYYAYWDALLQAHPNMLIDSCASGGRRNDLETLRRAVPLLRSDYIMEPVGNQCHTYALSFWVPFYGTGTGAIDPYLFRSVVCPHFTACFDMRKKDANWDLARKLVGEWRKIAPCMLGDYYPLTPYSLANDAWIAWQFDRPEEGDGVIQVFRRGDSIYRQAELKLHGLDGEKEYVITDLDTHKSTRSTGRELMEQGITIEIAQKPGAALLAYKLAN